MTEIFAYGTLRDAEYQEALFDRRLPTRPALLEGWVAVVADGGYLTVRSMPGGSVTGDLVALDQAALARADAWEEVPLYRRLRVQARDARGNAVPAWLYVRPGAGGEPVAPGILARHDRSTVLEHIRAFRARLGAHDQ